MSSPEIISVIISLYKISFIIKRIHKYLGIYRAPNEGMLAIERLTARSLPTRNLTKRSIIGGDLNLPQADWKGNAEKTDFRRV